MYNSIPRLLIGISAVLLHVLGYYLGAYYPVGSELYFFKVISGQLLDLPAGIVYSFGGMTIISDVLSFLYNICSKVEWVSLYFFMSSIFSLIALSYLVCIVILKKYYSKRNIGIVIGGLLLCLFWYYENTRLIEITRICLMHITSVILILALDEERKKSIWFYLFILIPGLLSVYYRLEALPFSVILVLPILVIRYNKIIHKKSLLILFLSFLPLYILFNYSSGKEDKDYRRFRAYQFSLFDYNDVKEQKITNELHAKALNLAKDAYLNDDFILDLVFSEQYLKKKDKSIDSFSEYINSISLEPAFLKSKAQNLDIVYCWYFIIITCTVLLCLLNKKIFFRSFIFLMYVLGVLALVLIMMKLEKRIVLPAFTVVLVVVLYNMRKNRLLVQSFLLTSILLMAFPILKNEQLYDTFKARYNDFLCFKHKVSSVASEKKILIDLDYITIDRLRMSFVNFENELNFFSIDNGILFFSEEYEVKVNQLFGTNKNSEIFAEITDRSDVVWVGTEERLKKIISFYNLVYNLEIQYSGKLDEDCFDTNQYEKYNVFHFYKVTDN